MAWNLFELASYDKFGFSRPDLEGNKLAKGMCLGRKARDKEVFYLVVPRVINLIIHVSGHFHLSATRVFLWYQAVWIIKEALYVGISCITITAWWLMQHYSLVVDAI